MALRMSLLIEVVASKLHFLPHRNVQLAWWKRRSAECGVRSAEYGVRSAECGVRSAEYGVRSTECGVRSLSQLKCFFRFGGDF